MQRHRKRFSVHLIPFLLVAACTACNDARGADGGPPDGALSACPTTGLISSSGTVTLASDCTIAGAVTLSGTARLTMTGATLTIAGNVTLDGDAVLSVTSGQLYFPQTSFGQYDVTLNGSATMSLADSTVKTSSNGEHYAISINAHDTSTMNVSNVALTIADGSWILGYYDGDATLAASDVTNFPTEIYPSESANVSVASSTIATVWLRYYAGDTSTLDVPILNGDGTFAMSASASGTSTWSVSWTDTKVRMGVESHPGSNVTVNGSVGNQAEVVLGYYVENPTSPVTLDGLSVMTNLTRTFTDSGRTLTLNNLYLGPFSWQVYASGNAAHAVTITNSAVLELAVTPTTGTPGTINLNCPNGVYQISGIVAGGPGAIINVTGCHIWADQLNAQSGGKINIINSTIHGNNVVARGAGSAITFTGSADAKNGVPSQTGCVPGVDTIVAAGGVPLCNPRRPLHGCASYSASLGATITGQPPCTP